MQVSIITVAYNETIILEKAINSFLNYNDLKKSDLEIILVDNSTTTEVEKLYLKQFEDKIIYMKNSNQGFGEANNRGASIAKGKYLFFLNPDCLLYEQVYTKAINIYESKNKIGMLGFKLINHERKILSFFWLNSYSFTKDHLIKLFNSLNIFLPRYMYTSGSNIFIKKEVFEKIEGFNEAIFMYEEEKVLHHKLRNINLKNYFSDEIKIIHLEGSSSKSVNKAITKLDAVKVICTEYNYSYKKIIKKEINRLNLKIFIRTLIKKSVKEELELLKLYKERYEKLT